MESVPDRAEENSEAGSGDGVGFGTADRAKAGPRAKAVLSRVQDFRTAARQLVAEPARLRKKAQEQHAELRAQAAAQSLQTMPLERLRAVSAARLRLNDLEKAGLRTVQDALTADPGWLQEQKGIGPKTAAEVGRAARRIADATQQETSFRFEPDHKDDKQTSLLQTIHALHAANDAIKIPDLDELLAQTDDLSRRASRTKSRVRMFLSREVKRNGALAALGEAETLLDDPRVGSVESGLQRISRAVADASVWREYERRAAAYNTLLANIAGAEVAERESARGFLPSDAQREVDATRLDSSWLRITLRGYQDFGAKFALVRKRCILGDEMGLGKTIQALAAMAHLRAHGRSHFLVVSPASVLINWINEISRHSGLVPHLLHGSERTAAARRWADEGGIGVTTYKTLQLLPEMERTHLDMLVVDEAHIVKNQEAKRSQTIAVIAERVEYILFLTGTPMENRVSEFKSLVSYLRRDVADRIKTDNVLPGARAFRRTVAPVYLRRNQEDVLTELPERLELDEWVQLTSSDEDAYRRAVATGSLMKLRKAAYETAEPAKVKRICEIVGESATNGWKVVVFSFFLDVLETVRIALGTDVVGVLSGNLSPAAKQKLIDDFTAVEGHAVLVSQIESGGLGLNIQTASVVILAEPQLKPSTEDQAIGRCHRLGQTRKVHVHRLMAKDTVDQRLHELLEWKSRLFDAYARESNTKVADGAATETGEVNVELLFDDSVPMDQRLVEVERQRLRNVG